MTPGEDHDTHDSLDLIAGDWLLRISEPEPSADVLQGWLAWYHADPAHRVAFDRLQRDYEHLSALPIHERQRLAATLLADAPAPPRHLWRPLTPPPRRRWLPAAVAALLLAAVAAYWVAPWTPHATESASWQTARGEHRVLPLPDGSTLTLGADSTVTIRYGADSRQVLLEAGEAYFEVARDRRRPFVVAAGGTSVRAVGTAFNIRRSDGRVAVAVSEGAVDVRRAEARNVVERLTAPFTTRPQPEALRVTAGHRVVLDGNPQTTPRSHPIDSESASAWRGRRLDFYDEPLAAVVATVNRYHSQDIVITDRALGRLTLTASVMDGHIDEWLDSLAGVLPLRIARLDDAVLISPP